MGGFEITYMGALVAGILSFLSPCVLPLVPPYLSFIGGVSLDRLTDDHPVDPKMTRRIFFSSLFFVFGFSTIFITLGATASVIGEMLADSLDVMTKVAGVVIILLGLHFMGILRIPLLYRDARFQAATRPAGLFGAYVIGLAFAFGWTPCVGPVLAAVLMVAGSEGSLNQGAGLLAVYSAGLGIPFLATALAMKPFLAAMGRFRRHLHKVEIAIGALLVLTGVLFITDQFSLIAYWLLETFPVFNTVG